MKSSATRAFANSLLLCLLALFSGLIGVTTVWARHHNARLAKTNRALEASIAETQRRIAEMTTLVEGERGNDVLRRRNAEWRLGFTQAVDAQVVRMPEDPLMRLARRHSTEPLNTGALSVNVRFAMRP
jgi:hypothetical protein